MRKKRETQNLHGVRELTLFQRPTILAPRRSARSCRLLPSTAGALSSKNLLNSGTRCSNCLNAEQRAFSVRLVLRSSPPTEE